MPDSFLVLSRDGTVIDVPANVPRAWIGTRLDDRSDVPEELKQLGREAIERSTSEPRPAPPPLARPPSRSALRVAVVDAIPLRCTPTNIRDLLRSSLEALRHQAEVSDIALRVHVEDDVPWALSLDRSKIAWAVTALVGNALRYVRHGSQTMPGGTITVHAALDATAHNIAVGVQDDGPGIPADTLQSLFRGEADSPGRALGLRMVRDVVAAHGGILNIESETTGLSRGTTVRFTLPVVG
jgi:signal transduction histidine kinase